MTFLSTALLAGGSIIDLDGTIFVQLAIFFVAFFILRSLVFKPMMKLFEAREEAIEGARQEARRMEREAEQKGDTFDAEMKKVRISAGEERDKLRQEGQRLERTILEKVRKETEETVSEAEKKMEAEASQVRQKLDANASIIAREIAEKLLEREVN